MVHNADQDVRFRGCSLVTGEPHVRFYAALPVRARNGIKIGTLCAMDTQAFDFNQDEIQALHDFHELLEETLLIRSIRKPAGSTAGSSMNCFSVLPARFTVTWCP